MEMDGRASNVDEKVAAPEGGSARYRAEGRETVGLAEVKTSNIWSRMQTKVIGVVDVGRKV